MFDYQILHFIDFISKFKPKYYFIINKKKIAKIFSFKFINSIFYFSSISNFTYKLLHIKLWLHNLIILIIWDKISMTHWYTFELIDRTFKDLTEVLDELFKGKIIVMGGDFRQILPIIIQEICAHIIDAYIKSLFL